MHKHVLTLCLAASLCSCMDDMEYNRISDKMNVNPTLLAPLATADVDIQYLFDTAENAVESYVANDGTNRLRIKANHDSIASYSLFDLIGISDAEFSTTRNYDWSAYDTKYIKKDVSIDASTSVPMLNVDSYGLDIQSLVASYEFKFNFKGFEHPASIDFKFAGNETSIQMKGTGTETVSNEMATITVNNGKINLGITLNIPAEGNGNLGSVEVIATLKNINSIIGSTEGFDLPTETYLSLTHMRPFRRIGRNIHWKNPQLWLTCTNSTPLDGEFYPVVTSMGDNEVLLNSKRYEIPAGSVGYEVVIDRDNSNIDKFFTNVPDSVLFDSKIKLSMPEGQSSVCLNKTDSVYLGYRYNVPFDFIVDGNVSNDTIAIEEVPNLDNVLRAKFVSYTVNGLPCGASIKMQLINTETNEKYSFIDFDEIAMMPTINSNGVSTDEKESVKTIELSRENINDLSKSNAIIIHTNLTTGGKYVSPKMEDRLQIDMSLAVEVDLTNE